MASQYANQHTQLEGHLAQQILASGRTSQHIANPGLILSGDFWKRLMNFAASSRAVSVLASVQPKYLFCGQLCMAQYLLHNLKALPVGPECIGNRSDRAAPVKP